MSIIKIKPYGEFNETHLEILKSNLRKETFPQFYTNQEFKSLKFIGTHLVPASIINRSGYGSSQSSRYSGLNPRYSDLKSSILETGWQLYQRPISIRLTKDNTYTFLDGRTKDKILEEVKFKNRIVNIYEMDDFDARLFADRCNAGEDSAPAGLILQEDLVGDLLRAIEEGELKNDPDEILHAVNLACGQGKFSSKKRDEVRWQVYHRQLNIQNTKLLPKSWANAGEVNVWLKNHNYINNSKVVYLPYSSTSAPKAIIAGAIKAQQNPGKEVRVVVFIRNFLGINLEKFYVTQMLKFKNEWYRYLNEIGSAYFDNKIYVENRVKIYGYIPSNIENICDDMEHMIIIGKNDHIIDSSYSNYTLNNTLGLDPFAQDQDGEIEEDEEIV
jgi:hypothetical protein